MAGRKIVVHGGVGEPLKKQDGCIRAAETGMAALRQGQEALDAALAAAVALEDDPRFDAGTGSDLSMDGRTVEMDAAVMDTRGRLAAIACVERVRNPVLVARALADTPHTFLAGAGAISFARVMGFADYDPVTEDARARHRAIMKTLLKRDPELTREDWKSFDLKRHWNFHYPWDELLLEFGHGTIGAVALDAEGYFAVCVSTGGFSPMLYGRVGDTPLVGCGFYAGPAGALCATGIGEYITRQMLCRTVYGWLENGMPLQEALERGIALFPGRVDVGLIGLTQEEAAVSANQPMPAHIIVE